MRLSSGVGERVGALIEPALEEMGYELVRVQLSSGRPPALQIMAERVDRVQMSVEDCATISRAISAILDVEDPIASAYTLEVSSPGIDRPLTRLEDFERFQGLEARIECREAIQGRRRLRGILMGLEGDSALIRPVDTEETIAVPIDAIQRAKLLLTDELIAVGGEPRRNAMN